MLANKIVIDMAEVPFHDLGQWAGPDPGRLINPLLVGCTVCQPLEDGLATDRPVVFA